MKPLCPFGVKCYRKNPKHFLEYRHEGGAARATAGHPATTEKPHGSPRHKAFVIDDDGVAVTGPPSADPATHPSPRKPIVAPPTSTTLGAASPRKTMIVLSAAGSPAAKRSRDEGDASTNGDADAWADILEVPKPRSSLLSLHPPASAAAVDTSAHRKTLLDVYEMAFPLEEMEAILRVAASLYPSSPLEAFPGWRLIGPFEVLAGVVTAFPTDAAKWRYGRFRYDPPEVQTVAIASPTTTAPHHHAGGAAGGGGGAAVRNHLAFHRDEPLQRPGMVVAGSTDDATFDILGDSLMGALQQLMKDGHHAAAAKALGEAMAKDGRTRRGVGDTVRARKKQVVATTIHRLGASVPYDAKTEVGYRPMMMPLAQFKALVAAWNAKGAGILPKQLDTLTEQFQWADIANDECDFGLNLEIGLNLFSLVVRRNDVLWHTWRVLETVYSLLGRDLYRHILKCHLRTLAGEEAPLLTLPVSPA